MTALPAPSAPAPPAPVPAPKPRAPPCAPGDEFELHFIGELECGWDFPGRVARATSEGEGSSDRGLRPAEFGSHLQARTVSSTSGADGALPASRAEVLHGEVRSKMVTKTSGSILVALDTAGLHKKRPDPGMHEDQFRFFMLMDAAGKHGNAEFQKVELPHHSFSAPLEFSNLLGDWMLSGSSIFLRERLLLHPHVNERCWAEVTGRRAAPTPPLPAQLTATFVANGAKDVSQAPSDQSFAFWFVRQNISGDFNETRMIRAASWKQGLEEEGYMLSGSKALFEGIGAVFSTSDVAKKPNTAVSFVSNDNHQSLSYFVDVPTSNAKILDFRNKEVEFKFRVQPTLVQAFLTLDGQTHECFSVDRAGFPVKVGGFIGFTAWSGSAGDGSMISDAISVTKVEVINFDDEAIGEDVVGATAEETSAYSELMSSNARHFADQKSQTEHLSRVTKMLASHLKETKPAYDVMSFQVSGMMDALNKLDRDCRVLTKDRAEVIGLLMPRRASEGHEKGIRRVQGNLCAEEMRILENEKISNRRQAKRPKNNLDELKSHVFGLRRILEKEPPELRWRGRCTCPRLMRCKRT
eukprot:g28275.t1